MHIPNGRRKRRIPGKTRTVLEKKKNTKKTGGSPQVLSSQQSDAFKSYQMEKLLMAKEKPMKCEMKRRTYEMRLETI